MDQTLLPNLFRTEYRNIVSVLGYLFGIEHIEVAEDIVSDTFLSATESWSLEGVPYNPKAWLYAVAKNKTRNYLRHDAVLKTKIAPELHRSLDQFEEIEIDLSVKNIADSQLAMIFTVCNPVNSTEGQIALALNLLCGFGIREIADAFLTNKDVIYKRISRAKEKLKEANIKIQHPTTNEIHERLDTVLATLYLLFSEGYYSMSDNTIVRKDLCAEAMRLNIFLLEFEPTNTPAANALFALMSLHSSRFDARINDNGEVVLYQDQDQSRWNNELIETGIRYLNRASTGNRISKYHLEAGIAYWHTKKGNTAEKWENILDLFNSLLKLEYSPIAAMNRAFALSKVRGKDVAIAEAEKLKLLENPLYYLLLGNLYSDIDDARAILHLEKASTLTTSKMYNAVIASKISRLREKIRKDL